MVPAGGLSPDHSRWIPAANNFFLPVKALSRVFRGKFVAGLRKLHAGNKLGFYGKLTTLQSPKAFSALLRSLVRSDWIVYSKRHLATPSMRCTIWAVTPIVLRFPVTALSPSRTVALLSAGTIRLTGTRSGLSLTVEEFLRRFLLQIKLIEF